MVRACASWIRVLIVLGFSRVGGRACLANSSGHSRWDCCAKRAKALGNMRHMMVGFGNRYDGVVTVQQPVDARHASASPVFVEGAAAEVAAKRPRVSEPQPEPEFQIVAGPARTPMRSALDGCDARGGLDHCYVPGGLDDSFGFPGSGGDDYLFVVFPCGEASKRAERAYLLDGAGTGLLFDDVMFKIVVVCVGVFAPDAEADVAVSFGFACAMASAEHGDERGRI